MKVSPIINHSNFKKPVFKGYMIDNSYGYSMIDTHGQRDAVEITVDAFHPLQTYKVYYADPLEQVTDAIREKVDYIVYDKEPKFPDINNEVSRNYFGEERVDYKKLLDNVRTYFYRLEMADRKTVGDYENNIWKNIDVQNSKEKAAYFKSRITDAQYNQETAANCIKMYDDAGDLRYRKERAEDEIVSLTEQKRNTEKALEITKIELERQTRLNEIITEKIKDLETTHKGYKNLYNNISKSYNAGLAGSVLTLPELKENIKRNKLLKDKSDSARRELYSLKQQHGYNNPVIENMNLVNENRTDLYAKLHDNFTKDLISEKRELENLDTKIKSIIERINFYKTQSENSKAAINSLKKYTEELPLKIQGIISEISNKKSLIEKIKAELIPHFDNLKNYVQSRGIKVIR